MKILMLGWELPPHNSGGLGVACLNLSRALANEGAEISFILPYNAQYSEIDFMDIYSATNVDPLFRYGGGSYESLRIGEEIIPTFKDGRLTSIREIQNEYGKFVNKFIKTHRPDVIHAHDWLTYEAAVAAKKKYNIPLVAHVHATEFDRSGMQTGNPLIHEIEYEGLMAADKIIAVSELTKRIVHEKYNIPLSKIDVVYNSLDDDYENGAYIFNNNYYNYINDLKSKGYTIASTVGRFTIQKGLMYLMRAAKKAISKNPKLLFVFAGDGEERNKLIRLAADLGIAKNVLFTGFIRGRQLRDIYTVSDIFIMSSISEPFGLTALEAAYHGNALILTKQSGVSEIIYSAFKYDFWDEDKLANEIVAISSSETLARVLKENAKEEFRQISWQKVARKCLKIYDDAMKERK
ncbi:glycosyltransferase family 4 protein [Candidatus Saccharibacteria bacterium]|nr:glycosyltransferase family 4 protein [Candidatus Saccharibacteria bacterium]